MLMKRLGDTAVSPDGKWLAYSVTTVDLDQNKKTAELLFRRLPTRGPGRTSRKSSPCRAGRLGRAVCS